MKIKSNLKYSLLIIISFINIIQCYYIVIDFSSTKTYDNSLCGDLNEFKNEIFPPCTSFKDAGERSRNLELEYGNQYKSNLEVFIISNKNESVIVNDSNTMSFGYIRNFCNIKFQIVNKQYQPIYNYSSTIVQLESTDEYLGGINGFISFNESIDNGYNCGSNKFNLIINNFSFNHIPTLFTTFYLYNPIFHERNIIFNDCIFLNTQIYSDPLISLTLFPLFKKNFYFNNCLFSESLNTIISSFYLDLEFNNCIFYNNQMKYEPLFQINYKSKFIFNNSTIKNNSFVGIVETINNYIEVVISNVTIQNNTFQFILVTDSLKYYRVFNHYNINITNLYVIDNLIIEGYSPTSNTYSQYTGFFDLSLYRVNCKEIKIVDHQHDETYITIYNSIFENNIVNKQVIKNFLKVDSLVKILIINTSIGNEFNVAFNSPNPFLLTINGSTINSNDPIIGTNIKVDLNNNIIQNFNQSIQVFNESTEVYLNPHHHDNEVNKYIKDQEKKRFIIIPIILFSTMVSLGLIFIVVHKVKRYIKNKKILTEVQVVKNEDEAKGEDFDEIAFKK